ncbi:tetratricopeptide repeat protein [Microbacteriaceae bacterium K1510]|nr:tetratricopeptide repeat protein [Microbacteriaceae bacterium K1510]
MNAAASKLSLALDRALQAYRDGRLAEAEEVCLKIVATKRNFFDGLYVLAVVQAAAGRSEEAVANYNRALAVQPKHAEALSNRGNALKVLGRLDEALASYDKALALQPNYATGHSNRGAVLSDLKRLPEALAAFERALALQPDHIEALYNHGHVLHGLGRFEEAIASYDRVIALRPAFVAAYINRASSLNELNRYDEALASCDRALAAQPNFVEAHANRGMALHALARYDEAMAAFDRALALAPDYATAWYNRGATLHALTRYEDAVASYDRAVAIKPDYAAAYSNRGASLYEMMRFTEALASYDRAVEANPSFPDAHWNEASLRLLMGDLTRGFAEYEWRWTYDRLAPAKRDYPQPLWRGEDVSGRTLLLYSEQGFGDTLQFCRYAPLAAARGARVVLEVETQVQRLMQSLPGVEVVPKGSPPPAFDFHCPLMSLPLAFATELATVPADVPYLSAPSEQAATWAARLPQDGRRKIGLCWSGNGAHLRDKDRSIAFEALAPLLDADAHFIVVQKDVRHADGAALAARSDVLQVGELLGDFADTAALLAQLDLVITVDTSIAHLAGALGRPVWVLLPRIPDWRWLLNRADSPWYPTARLFRQEDGAGWGPVIARMRAALDQLGS